MRTTLGTEAEVVDLGLGIDEAAKILAIQCSTYITHDNTVGADTLVAISFDPEDNQVSGDDDEQFFVMNNTNSAVGTAQGSPGHANVFANYIGLNLITTRNLAIIFTTKTDITQLVYFKIFYEKFKPTDRELVQLIAQRR